MLYHVSKRSPDLFSPGPESLAVFPPIRLRAAWTLGGLTIKETIARTYRTMNDHEIMTRASAVAFYAMLATVPFLALILTIAVKLLPDVTRGFEAAHGMGDRTVVQLEATLKELFPENAFKIVEEQIIRIQEHPPVGLLSLGLLITLWTASTLFVSIMDAMNRIEGVKETRSFLRLRLVAIMMTLIEAVILVGSLLLILAWPVLLRWMGVSAPTAAFLTVIQWAGLFVAVLSSFAVAFFIAPDSEQRWEWITPGSVVGTICFLLASFGFRVYIQNWTSYDKTYGSLAGVVVLMFWFWITSLVFLVAAQMNKVIEDASPLGKSFGQKVDVTEPPDLAHAEPVTQAETEVQANPTP
jgi:membrane protein